jgi:hypothetical protein
MDLHLRLLRIVRAVADHASFAKAAKAMQEATVPRRRTTVQAKRRGLA